jgi:hypothetical protein
MKKSIILLTIIFIFLLQQGQCAAPDVAVPKSEALSLSEAMTRGDIVEIIEKVFGGVDPAPLAGSDLCGPVVRRICKMVAQCSHEDASLADNQKLLRKILVKLRRFINDTFKNTYIQLEEADIDSPAKPKISIPLFILDRITLLIHATKTANWAKDDIAKLLIVSVVSSDGTVFKTASDTEVKVTQYCQELAAAWEATQIATLGDALKDVDGIAAKVEALLADVLPDKINVTVISLPTLLQSAAVAGLLYKDKDTAPADKSWSESCVFYSVFHLVNAWRYRGDAAAMLKSFSRNNFSEFLGMTRSGFDLALQLQKPASAEGDVYADFRARKKYYPTITTDLALASTFSLGSLNVKKISSLSASYAFLSGIDEATFQYCPVYTARDADRVAASLEDRRIFGDHSFYPTDDVFYGHQPHKKNDDLKRYLQDVNFFKSSQFVFPVLIHTEMHASAALVYQFPSRSAAGWLGAKPHYIVFFAESNRIEGHLDRGKSIIGESFDFKKAFKAFFAKINRVSDYDVHVKAPSEALTQNDIWRLVQGISTKFNSFRLKATFDFMPDEEAQLSIARQNTPTELFRNEMSMCRDVNTIERLLRLGADPSVRDDSGNTMFHWAIYNKNPAVLKVMCTVGKAAINIPDRLGYTPLSLAVNLGYSGVVPHLLKAGASHDIPTKSGQTALDLARAKGMHQAVALLQAHAAQLSAQAASVGQAPEAALSAEAVIAQ